MTQIKPFYGFLLSENIAATGGHRYNNEGVYVGSWNTNGQKHGQGHEIFPNGTRYDGLYEDGLFNGLGVLSFPDGAKYV